MIAGESFTEIRGRQGPRVKWLGFRKLTKDWLFPFSRVGLIRVALGLLAAVCKPALVSIKLGSNVSICLFFAWLSGGKLTMTAFTNGQRIWRPFYDSECSLCHNQTLNHDVPWGLNQG